MITAKLRRRPNGAERTAAALLAIKKGEDWLIPEPLRSSGTAEEILAYIEWHHETPAARGGSTAPQNITPMAIADHAIETATKTVPSVAKGKRLEAAQAEFRRKLLAKAGQGDEQSVGMRKKIKRAWPSRPMNGSKDSPWKKRMNGKTERR